VGDKNDTPVKNTPHKRGRINRPLIFSIYDVDRSKIAP
jgi:hypothetical protein